MKLSNSRLNVVYILIRAYIIEAAHVWRKGTWPKLAASIMLICAENLGRDPLSTDPTMFVNNDVGN